MNSDQVLLVDAMLNPLFYNHPVDKVELVETHISWVFLAGAFAYKVKKPCNLKFLDFSTLGKRHHFCNEELRLNRRFAPGIYLEVVTIGLTGNRLVLGAEPAIEYAVKMKRFPQEMQLDRLCETGCLGIRHLQQFATTLADIHHRAPVMLETEPFDLARRILDPALQNFDQLRPFIADPEINAVLDTLEQWSRDTFQDMTPILQSRLLEGYIRECHGDVHLGNMFCLDDEPALFDCIEFSESLRWIDVMNDIAFLLMDLDDRGETSLGWAFLNHYMRQTGDYAGVALLPFYKVYRAMVRAKVGYLRLAQASQGTAESVELEKLAQSYIWLAASYIKPKTPTLMITHGLSGSGKTTFITDVAPYIEAVCVHSDIERKRLHGLNLTDKSGSTIGTGLYNAAANQKTYARLRELTGQLLKSGCNVIVDATFIAKERRQMIQQLADEIQVPLRILDFRVDIKELNRRLKLRKIQSDNVSEASASVLEYQLTHEEPLDETEREQAIPIFPDTSSESIVHNILGA